MKLCVIPSAAIVLLQASLALGAVMERSVEADITSSADDAPMLDELSLRDTLTAAPEPGANYAWPKPAPLVPGRNFLRWCKQDREGDILEITEVNMEPRQPVRGENFSFEVRGSGHDRISNNTKIEVRIKLGINEMYHKTFDFCDEISRNPSIGVRCPIAGVVHIPWVKHSYTMPKKLPRAIYYIWINIVRDDGHPVACIEGDFRVS